MSDTENKELERSDEVEAFADACIAVLDETTTEELATNLFLRFVESRAGTGIVPVLSGSAFSHLDQFEIGFGAEIDREALGEASELIIAALHDRDETGSYYTPAYVVEYLVEETVDPAVAERLGAETVDEALDSLSPDAVDAALTDLDRVSVCDSACGSGHFLIGALHRITEIRRQVHAVRGDDPSEYELRTRTAQYNLYGVDLLPDAIEFATLRLHLECLAVAPDPTENGGKNDA